MGILLFARYIFIIIVFLCFGVLYKYNGIVFGAEFNENWFHSLPTTTNLRSTRVKLFSTMHQELPPGKDELVVPIFRLDFGRIDFRFKKCNQTKYNEILTNGYRYCERKCEPGVNELHCLEEREKCRKNVEENAEESCLPNNTGCQNEESTIFLFICWDSLFEGRNGFVYSQFYVNNEDEGTNSVAKICNTKKQSALAKHGIGIGICSEYHGGKQYTSHIIIQTSYSSKKYNLVPNEDGSFEIALVIGIADQPNDYMFYTRLLKKARNNGRNVGVEVLNVNESMPNKQFQLSPRALNKMVEQNALAFAFMDMLVEYLANGSMVREIELVYSEEDCFYFEGMFYQNASKMETIKLQNCKKKEDDYSCENQFGQDCEKMRIYKECICESMWLCQNKPIQPELEDRRRIPDWIIIEEEPEDNLVPGNDEEKRRKEFFHLNHCDNPNFFGDRVTGGIELTPLNVERQLEYYEKEMGCGRGKGCRLPLKNHNIRKRQFFHYYGRPEGWEWRWKNPIQYKFSDDLNKNDPKTDELRKTVLEAIAHIEIETCIHFQYNESVQAQMDHMFFDTAEGRCQSAGGIGRGGGKHVIYVDTIKYGVAVHEIGHALGLHHEMIRADRDKYYAYIDKQFLQKLDLESNTREYRLPAESIYGYNTPFEFASVMHYQMWWKNDHFGKKIYSFIPYLRAYQHSISFDFNGGLAYRDSKVLNKYYCADSEFNSACNNSTQIQCLRDGYQDPNNCANCRCPHGFSGKHCEGLASFDKKICNLDVKSISRGVTQFTGSISGNGNCYFLFQPFTADRTPLEFHEITLQRLEGFNCPKTYPITICGSENWIYPCENYLRIQFQQNKTETGARICCRQELPLSITKNEKNEIGEILLELRMTNFSIGQKDVSFDVIIKTAVPEIEYACDCANPDQLWNTERDPNVILLKINNDSSTKCNENGVYPVNVFCSIGQQERPKNTHLIINGIEWTYRLPIVPLQGANFIGIGLVCQKNGQSESYWAVAMRENGKRVQPFRVDEFLCYNDTMEVLARSNLNLKEEKKSAIIPINSSTPLNFIY